MGISVAFEILNRYSGREYDKHSFRNLRLILRKINLRTTIYWVHNIHPVLHPSLLALKLILRGIY